MRNRITRLEQLRDVDLTGAASGEVPGKNTTTGKWDAIAAGGISGGVANGGSVPKIQAGTLASRPAAATFGVGAWWDTTGGRWSYSDGATWTTASAASSVDSLWVPAGAFGAIGGSPSLAQFDVALVGWLLDDSASESVATSGVTGPGPADLGWSTYDLYLWWGKPGANSGDVVLFVGHKEYGDGDSTALNATYSQTIAAPAQHKVKGSKMNSSALAVSATKRLVNLGMGRTATDSEDTLTGDVTAFAVELRKVS